MHQGWRCELPDELEVGTTLVGVAGVKGMRNRVTWTVRELDAPTLLAVTGDGVGGTKYGLRMTVNPPIRDATSPSRSTSAAGRCSAPSARPPPVWSKATSSAPSSDSRSSTPEAPCRVARNFNPAPVPVRHAGGHECQTNSGGLLQPVHRRRLRHDCPCRTGFRRRPTSAVRPERGLPDRRARREGRCHIREPAQTFVTGDRFASVLDLRLRLAEGDLHGLRGTGCVQIRQRHVVSGCLRTHRRDQRVGAVDRVGRRPW